MYARLWLFLRQLMLSIAREVNYNANGEDYISWFMEQIYLHANLVHQANMMLWYTRTEYK